MDRKTFAIGILSVTAVVLFIAQFVPIRMAVAGEAVKDRDYIAVTARSIQNDEALYVTDNRSGRLAVFTWDPSSKTVRLRAVRAVADAFAN